MNSKETDDPGKRARQEIVHDGRHNKFRNTLEKASSEYRDKLCKIKATINTEDNDLATTKEYFKKQKRVVYHAESDHCSVLCDRAASCTPQTRDHCHMEIDQLLRDKKDCTALLSFFTSRNQLPETSGLTSTTN